MQVEPVLIGLRSSLEHLRALAGGDPSIDDAVTAVVEAIGPALKIAAMELAQQAATEIGAQLTDHRIDVVVVDGDPMLRVGESPSSNADAGTEEFDARITLRLPPSLKSLIEDSATVDGDSVNSWVVDALNKRAKRPSGRGRRVTESFDL